MHEENKIRNEKLDNQIIDKYILNMSSAFGAGDITDIQNKIKKSEENIKTNINEYTKNYNKIELEIGCGYGKFLVEHAIEREDVYFIGIESNYKACKKLASKASKRNVENICVIFGDAQHIIRDVFDKNYLFDTVYINFPDPWPKKRHNHRRIVSMEFISNIHKILKDNGLLYVVSDYEEYAKEVMSPNLEASSSLFKNTLESPWTHHLENYKQTLYEIKMRELGKEIYYMVYQVLRTLK